MALSESSEVLMTLAVLAQWPRCFRSERDFWRFASSYLRSYYFPAALSAPKASSQPEGVRALEPELRALQGETWLAGMLADPKALYRVVDTPPSGPGDHREGEGLWRKGGLLAGQARALWAQRLQDRVGLGLLQGGAGGGGPREGVVTAFAVWPPRGLSDERPIGEAALIIARDRHGA